MQASYSYAIASPSRVLLSRMAIKGTACFLGHKSLRGLVLLQVIRATYDVIQIGLSFQARPLPLSVRLRTHRSSALQSNLPRLARSLPKHLKMLPIQLFQQPQLPTGLLRRSSTAPCALSTSSFAYFLATFISWKITAARNICSSQSNHRIELRFYSLAPETISAPHHVGNRI